VILVSVITSAAVSAAMVLGMARFGGDEDVPDLTGYSLDAARGILDARGLRLVHRGDRHDPEVLVDAIVEQQPRAGSLVPRGSEVTVIVSLGPDLVEVPDVTGVALAIARQRLTDAGLRVGEVAETGTGSPGTVTSTSPSAGQRVRRETEVEIVAVPETQMVAVPDLTGMSSRAAREALTTAGLTVGTTRHGFDENRDPYVILRQNPAAGTQVAAGTAIEITINDE
jgi:serine/threonine-protein kinase